MDQGVIQFKDQYGSAAEAYGLPALPDVSVQISPEVSFPAAPQVTMPDLAALPSAEDVTARVSAGLEKARQLVAEYTAPLLSAVGGLSGDTSGDVTSMDDLTTSAEGGSRSGVSTAVSLLFLLGAGTGAVVYYLGPEKSKALAEEGLVRAKAWSEAAMAWTNVRMKQTLKWADAQAASLGLKPYLDAVVRK